MAANPMTQFEVYRIGPEIKIGTIDISFTNASLFMIISSLAILIIFDLGSKKKSVLPNKIQLLAELSYTFVSKMINDTAGSKGKPYFGFIFSLFMFVLFCNMLGMLPYAFTVTSQYNSYVCFSGVYFYWGYNYWFYKTWSWLFKVVCSKWCSNCFIAVNCNY